MNTGAFAGHTDWRLPNVNEAQSLGFYGTGFDSVFDNNCVATCTVLTCSCIGDDIWTPTTRLAGINQAIRFTISQTLSASGDKTIDAFNVRAVRGGQ